MKREVQMKILLTPEEKMKFQQVADAMGLDLSTLIRSQILKLHREIIKSDKEG